MTLWLNFHVYYFAFDWPRYGICLMRVGEECGGCPKQKTQDIYCRA